MQICLVSQLYDPDISLTANWACVLGSSPKGIVVAVQTSYCRFSVSLALAADLKAWGIWALLRTLKGWP